MNDGSFSSSTMNACRHLARANAGPADLSLELSLESGADDNSGDFRTGEVGIRKKDSMNTYVALLRGINVGGHRLIKMQDLVRIFASVGCKNVRTFQQAGNVI